MTSHDIQVLIGCITGIICFSVFVLAMLAGNDDTIQRVLQTWSDNKAKRVEFKIELEKVKLKSKSQLCVSCEKAIENK